MTAVHRSPVRTFLLVALMTAAGTILSATGASADVSISPAQAVAGDAADVTFHVVDDRPGVSTTQVRVEFPQNVPIAEIYPMSVEGWAPETSTRNIDQPVKGIHSTDVTSLTTAITWVRADGAPSAKETALRVEMGPVPRVTQLVFDVVQTYSDGSARRWSGPAATGPGTVLSVRPAAAVQAEADLAVGAPAAGDSAAGIGHGGMDMGTARTGLGSAGTDGGQSGGADLARSAMSTGNGMIDILAGILGGALVTLLAGALIVARIRKDAAPHAHPDHSDAARVGERKELTSSEVG
jgi:uncharacterized protein YcnI